MINNQSSPEEKVRLFSSLFQGRSDLYARRYVSTTTGKVGYSPVCLNRWQAGVCDMRHVRCAVCPHRRFASLTDDVFLHHLLGTDEGRRPFSAAVYPLRLEERTRFAVASINETNWREDAAAVRLAARDLHVPCAVELARRGEGAHVREKEPVTRKLWDGTSVCPLGGNGVPVTERNERSVCPHRSELAVFPPQCLSPQGRIVRLSPLGRFKGRGCLPREGGEDFQRLGVGTEKLLREPAEAEE